MTNINTLVEQLESLSLFELSRLHSAISKTLDDPARNEAIKRHVYIGMKITYFAEDTNNLVEATVFDVGRTRASVVNTHDGKRWRIKLHTINLHGIDVHITPKKQSGGLNRNSLKVRDHVGWNSKLGHDLYGVVEKLNPKKALIRLGNGERWTVSYSLLFLVMDNLFTPDDSLCIEGEVLSRII